MNEIFEIDMAKIEKHFSEERIQGFMKDLGFTKLEAILYLWFFNNVGIRPAERSKDNGRAMYRKFAKAVTGILKEPRHDSD